MWKTGTNTRQKLRAVEEEYSGNAPELDDYDEGTPDSEASKQVAMQIHEDAQAKKLADEMSRLSEEEGRTAVVEEDDDMGATRTIADLASGPQRRTGGCTGSTGGRKHDPDRGRA
ncbi:MAG: hypothetical protein ACLUD2_21360 [Clostridium sp.]